MLLRCIYLIYGICQRNPPLRNFSCRKVCAVEWIFVYLRCQSSPSLLTMLKSCGAFFVYTHLNMANLVPFTKQFESSENLVDLLESRGLQICNKNKAIQYLVITDCLLICILCWRCPSQHICTRKVLPSKRWWCFIVLTRNCDCSCSTR